MPVEHQNANPVIIEPAASSDLGTPSTFLAPAFNGSSSSSSSDSFRPHSQGSSATSPSEYLAPASGDIEPYALTNIRPPTTPDVEPLPPPMDPFSPTEPSRNTTTSSTFGLSERAEGSTYSNRAVSLSSYCPTFARGRWPEHSLGVFGLVASLVGLLFIGVRTYKLAVISTENSTIEGCTGLIQAGFVTLENSTQLCKTIMKIGPLSSPYHLGKRAVNSWLALSSNSMKDQPKQTCRFPYIGCQPYLTNRDISAPAILVSTILALAWLMVMITRRNARSTEVFESPACSDIHIIRHQDTGPETVTGQGIIQRHNSADHGVGELRKRIRASQDQDNLMKDSTSTQLTDKSSTTLVKDRSDPKVSLHNRSSGEKHEGLIELQMNGHTKAFFKLETGEFFHLKHWRDKHHKASDSSQDTGNPLSVEEETFA